MNVRVLVFIVDWLCGLLVERHLVDKLFKFFVNNVGDGRNIVG